MHKSLFKQGKFFVITMTEKTCYTCKKKNPLKISTKKQTYAKSYVDNSESHNIKANKHVEEI